MTTMQGDDLLEARREQARSHPIQLNILALVAQGRGGLLDPNVLQRELPGRPTLQAISYHLLVLRQVDLLPSQVTD